MRFQEMLVRIWRLYKPFRLHIAIVFVLIAITRAGWMLAPYLIGRLSDALNAGAGLGEGLFIAGLMLGLSLLLVLVSWCKERVEIAFLDRELVHKTAEYSMWRWLSFSIGQHVSKNSGVSQKIASDGGGDLRKMMQIVVYQVVPTVCYVAFLIGALLWLDMVMGMLVVAGMAAFVCILGVVNIKYQPLFRKIQDIATERGRLHNDIFRNPALVIASAREKLTHDEYVAGNQKVSSVANPVWARYINWWNGSEVVLELIKFLVMALMIYYVTQGRYTTGQLFSIWYWCVAALGYVQNFGIHQRELMLAYTSVQKYFELMDKESDVKPPDNPVRPTRCEGEIEFSDVTFAYPAQAHIEGKEVVESSERGKQVLHGINLLIHSRQKIAIVGKSGAGKTTIANLIVRAFGSYEGRITIDGHDLLELDLKFLRRSIGYVPQNVKLFDQSIRYNIVYGLEDERVSDSELDVVMEMVQLKDFVHGLKYSYDTVVGENGAALSGGQIQRLGIARALIKKPAILIFDESTNNLDADNEAHLQEAIDKAAETATTIIIAHRLSTIAGADKVLAMSEGRVVGFGPHSRLYQECSEYRYLVDRQMAKMLDLANEIGLQN